ncbi:MAG: hypothetical protein DHS20C18_46350 [Saprospiraceae bacterium]|nr:MAG: hypothetical protein DHS20C18_46350 [Saprospiraceae bacterium]
MGLGCSCVGPPTFCETISNNANNLLIIKGKKIADIEHGMDIQVQGIFSGTEERSVIRVWGDNGFLCRVYPSTFEIGEEVIFALQKIEEAYTGENPSSWQALEQVGDYILSICGTYYIRDEVEAEEITECLGEERFQCAIPNLNFHPNPSRERVFLDVASNIGTVTGTLTIFDTSGKQVVGGIPIRRLLQNGRIELQVSNYARGVYFIRIDSPDFCGIKSVGKVVVM